MRETNKWLLSASLLFLGTAIADDSANMEPYPASGDGLERMVFRVPPADSEADLRVEIIVGKVISVDCNRTSFGGVLERRTVEGWGYPYFSLEKIGGPMSTRMACPPDYENTNEFVQVAGDGFLQRYNSKLPVVVYVPDGFEVRYRVWAAGDAIGRAAAE